MDSLLVIFRDLTFMPLKRLSMLYNDSHLRWATGNHSVKTMYSALQKAERLAERSQSRNNRLIVRMLKRRQFSSEKNSD